MSLIDRLAGASRIGLGLAAVGRPGYINLGRDADLPAERTVEALRERAHALLDSLARIVAMLDKAPLERKPAAEAPPPPAPKAPAKRPAQK